MIYGALPKDLGLIDLSPVEMMFWMYCPISTPELRDQATGQFTAVRAYRVRGQGSGLGHI